MNVRPWALVATIVAGATAAADAGHFPLIRLAGGAAAFFAAADLVRYLIRRLHEPRIVLPADLLLFPGDKAEWTLAPGRAELRTAGRRYVAELAENENAALEAVRLRIAELNDRGRPADLNALFQAELGRRPLTDRGRAGR